ncbi:hypothetical protein LWI29_038260 [Acer saccharum]|uniref:RNase H type-1 domain-containing protein n=1 Tax=Acer saccharum TaxID=4024 RepID=A0AA39S254_ACESA|nr:hypothetical protein LWI29_038260 [Acer saccharum]
MDWSTCFLTEFLNSTLDGGQVRSIPVPMTQVWNIPPLGFYRVNTNATVDGAGQVNGIGIVIRNGNGIVMALSSQRIIATYSPHVAETVAVLRGLQLACGTVLVPVVAETDAAVVTKWISEGAKSQPLTRRHNTAFFSNSSESHTSERWPSRRITLPITSLTRPTGTVSRNPKGTDTLPPKGWIPSF